MKTKLTAELQERILDFISQGHFIECIANALGFHKSTYYRWLEKGEQQKKGLYRDFCDAVKVQEGVAEATLIDRIQRSQDWRAAAWILERKFPDRWGRRRFELTGPDGGPIPLSSENTPPDEPLRVYIMPTPELSVVPKEGEE